MERVAALAAQPAGADVRDQAPEGAVAAGPDGFGARRVSGGSGVASEKRDWAR